MIGVVRSVGLVGWLVGFLLMVMVDGSVELVGSFVVVVRYSSSGLSISVGALLVGGSLAGVSFCLCSCRRQSAGWQG